jgi:4-alpha-glucanotransferase
MIESTGRTLRELSHEARRALGIDDLVLVVHDASFPSEPGEDIGRGTPYSRGARRLFEFADGLGFTGLQLGPQGVTTRVNRSPYDGTVFSRNPLSISIDALHRDPAWEALVDAETLHAAISSTPPGSARAHHDYAEAAHARALDTAFHRFAAHGSRDLRARFAAFRSRSAEWLDHDASFEANAVEYGSDDPAQWPTAGVSGAGAAACVERYAFAQFVVHGQHDAFRDAMRALGWKVFGDMQIGLSPRDRWRREALFLDSYALGAPPSRTDPQGQPWGYAVLQPGSGAALAFFTARIRKMAREYDGIRVDHPHGLVCPWVYDRAVAAADPLRAVAGGARLFESPDLADHAGLAGYAIARPDQIDRTVTRYDDRWVRSLDDAQVDRYSERFGILIAELASAGHSDLVCEVLSTSPYPLDAVLRRYGLGRFRVTQKADLANPRDAYRSENALPRDWIMVGTHDTAPLAVVVDGWFASGKARSRAAYLAERLGADETQRSKLAEEAALGPSRLLAAMFADLFASPARHVLVFMSDLFGIRDVYNRPGTVNEENWALRIPSDFERLYRTHLAAGTAMDVTGALATALRARGAAQTRVGELAAGLERARRAHLSGGPAIGA